MSVETKNLKLTIINPGVQGLSAPIAFQKVTAEEDQIRIPRRYPFTDISNYNALAAAGYFRHGSKAVSSLLGGSETTNTEGKLGFLLPQTEKLFLLVRQTGVASTGTAKAAFKIEGSILYNIPDVVVELAADATFQSGTRLYELNLYDFGLFISGVAGEDGIIITVTDDESTPALEFALVARLG